MSSHSMISNLRDFLAGLDAATRIRHGVPIPPAHLARAAKDDCPPIILRAVPVRVVLTRPRLRRSPSHVHATNLRQGTRTARCAQGPQW